MNNLALCESQSLREEQLKGLSQDRALETLDKAKALVMAIHHGVAIAVTEQIAEYFEVSVEAIEKLVQRHRDEFSSDGLKIVQGKTLKEHTDSMSVCENSVRLRIWTPRAALRCGMLLRDSKVAKQVRSVILDITDLQGTVEKLERQFLPDVPIKSIDEAAVMLGKRFGAAYEQRFLTQNLSKFHPHFALPPAAPEELASLPTAKALLTPTQVAEQLGLFCKSNSKSGDARRVNKLLAELGYQTKIDGTWSATDKAIGLNLCDRKPVDTGSRTQKDQLFWSADVVAILQEHVVNLVN